MKSHETVNLKWGVGRRLEFIEFRLFWEGGLNRSDIIDHFGVSVPQASKDLSLYQNLAPGNARYNKRSKRYVASDTFTPMFITPDSADYLSRLRSLGEGLTTSSESWLAAAPPMDVATTPRRHVETGMLRAMLGAIRAGHSIDIHYQTMAPDREQPIWRRVTPHALGHDGFRWHARAYCHVEARFKDFALPRILGERAPGEPGADSATDTLWNHIINLEIGPHPGLTLSQQAVVTKDFNMHDGKAVLPVRIAMLFYVLKKLGLLEDATSANPHTHHIVDLNRPSTIAIMNSAGLPL